MNKEIYLNTITGTILGQIRDLQQIDPAGPSGATPNSPSPTSPSEIDLFDSMGSPSSQDVSEKNLDFIPAISFSSEKDKQYFSFTIPIMKSLCPHETIRINLKELVKYRNIFGQTLVNLSRNEGLSEGNVGMSFNIQQRSIFITQGKECHTSAGTPLTMPYSIIYEKPNLF